MHPLTPRQLAWRLAQDLPANATFWFGAGLPQLLHEFSMSTATGNGRPLDLAVITADEVGAAGDFNSSTMMPAAIRRIWIMAPLFRDDGRPLLVEHCSTATRHGVTATRLYTDIAVFDFVQGRVQLRGLIEGITLQTLQVELDVELQVSPELTLLQIPLALGGNY
ncbi:MAG: hypothetical protein ACO3PV_09515 [Pseudohongiellaceae bacterium]